MTNIGTICLRTMIRASTPFFLAVILASIAIVGSIKCYYCQNTDNPSCGVDFKSYQFSTNPCPDDTYICALQRQPPIETGWIGVLRNCYKKGTLDGIDESNGCRNWTVDGFDALFCFCDTDSCNTASQLHQYSTATGLCLVLYSLYLIM